MREVVSCLVSDCTEILCCYENGNGEWIQDALFGLFLRGNEHLKRRW